ncbi:TIGR02281 family clan AA aspartic protease [Aphanizomenon sp. UHCC 0183]|uniref:retropepsin-like aspartic protease family protein n=1 Tax=Aphanizomenon sp. UHCC 0183 TaxID=2590028 RepID=UPI001445A447|nr:retropepsin-like aspartic protease [Aphanizomenon sp. UHCC 0183]
MLQYFLSRTALIFCSVSLAVLTVACDQDQQTTITGESKQSLSTGSLAAIRSSSQRKQLLASPNSTPRASASTQLSSLEMALDKAAGAKSISQSAVSVDDWKLVVSQFQDAIALMKQVRRNSGNFAFAQRQIVEYRRQVALARRKAYPKNLASSVTQPQSVVIEVPQLPGNGIISARPSDKALKPSLSKSKPSFSQPPTLPRNHEVFIAPIKRRVGGTPIIEVTFNGTQQFEMIVDTGASGTVITQKIAAALGVVTVGKTKANTASAKAVEFPIGYLDSMEVGGMTVNKVPVAIAGTELETGLLGHDFFGNYDVTIKRNVVEFRPQGHSEANPSENPLNVPALSKGYRFVKFL